MNDENEVYIEKRKRINVSFSIPEYERIQALSDSLNTKPATLVRKITLATMKGEKIQSPGIEEDLKGLTFLLRNFASNLNQIARHSNRVQHVIDENETLDLLRKFEATLKDSVNRLSG